MAGNADRPQRSRHAWFQFSLRSLLIVITALSVWLGIAMNKARRQARAVATIKRTGADVYYDYQTSGPRADGDRFMLKFRAEPGAPKWLVKLVGIDLFETVTFIDFGFSGVEEHDLEVLKDLPDIQCLEVGGSKLSKKAAPLLIELRNLQYLGLEETGLDDATIAKIQTALPHCRIKRSD